MKMTSQKMQTTSLLELLVAAKVLIKMCVNKFSSGKNKVHKKIPKITGPKSQKITKNQKSQIKSKKNPIKSQKSPKKNSSLIKNYCGV